MTHYVNVNPACDLLSSHMAQHHQISTLEYNGLDSLVDDGEAELIRVYDVLGTIQLKMIPDTISYWLKKLGHGGEITFVDTDVNEIAAHIFNASLTPERINELAGNRTLLSIGFVGDFLRSKGLRITQKAIHDFKFTIKAVRP